MREFLKTKRRWVIGAGVLLILIILVSSSGGDSGVNDVIKLERGDVSTEVAVTGRVKSADAVNLAFERSGKVSSVRVLVGARVYAGQLLATLSMGDLLANLDKAKAIVKAQEAALAALRAGSRTEDVTIARSKYDTALLTVENKRTLLANSVSTAYIKVGNAFAYYIDQFFSNPHSINPQVAIPLRGDYKTQIEAGRTGIETVLTASWTNETVAIKSLTTLRDFASLMGIAINDLSSTAQLSATVVGGYKTDVSLTRTAIETEVANITTASQAYTDAVAAADLAKRQYELSSSPARPEDIQAGEAKLDQALADQRSAGAEVMKAEIFAPFAGIITRQEYRLGETVSISDASISLIDDKALDIEVNIPEADIAEVKIGQDATVDLDAYGPDISFNAKVVAIDPGETIVDGVATYKATLHFLTQDERIRSGMTANVNILTNKHEGVLRVPSRMITNEDGKSYIYIGRDASKALKTEIQIVLRGSDGAVEVSSLPGSAGAIKEGDSVTLVN